MSYFVRSPGLPQRFEQDKQAKPRALVRAVRHALMPQAALDSYQRNQANHRAASKKPGGAPSRVQPPKATSADRPDRRIRTSLWAPAGTVDPPPAAPPRHPLPELPKGLHWPEDFDKAPEFGRHPQAPGGVVAYLQREWTAIIAAKKIDMPKLREHFPKAAGAISAHTTPHRKTGEIRELPKQLTIPVAKQVNTQKLAQVRDGKVVVSLEEAARLFALERRRTKREQGASHQNVRTFFVDAASLIP
nr:hypothetical protein [uncultured Rhodopila sp.]